MINKSFFLIITYFLLNFPGTGLLNSFAQTNSAELFDDFCADCHSIGEGDMRGPDLLGIELKRSEDWLIKFIRSAKTMISSGDPESIKSWEKYGKKKMPDTDLPDQEIKSLIDYIRSFNKSKPEVITTTPSITNKSAVSDGRDQTIENLTSKVNEYEGKLQDIEKK